MAKIIRTKNPVRKDGHYGWMKIQENGDKVFLDCVNGGWSKSSEVIQADLDLVDNAMVVLELETEARAK